MINYDSILSAFDGKPTLLQWLKMVKKALDESILKNVDIAQNGEKVVFTFNFEDGTSISTPEVTLPKGDKGEKGKDGVGIVRMETTNSQVVGVNTESNIRVELSDGSIKQFKAYAKNGSDGVSITGVNTVGNEVVGDETLTTLRANYSNNTSDEFIVKAKNGVTGHIYLHSVKISNPNRTVYFNIYSRKETLAIDDVFAQIPENNYIPVCLYGGSAYGVLIATKQYYDNEYHIYVQGLQVSSGSTSITSFTFNKNNSEITDTLLGDNL